MSRAKQVVEWELRRDDLRVASGLRLKSTARREARLLEKRWNCQGKVRIWKVVRTLVD